MSARHDNLVGIDLGTTVSVIAKLEPSGEASTIPNTVGDPLTPSAIYFEDSTVLVGKTAKDAAAIDSSKAAMYVKRDMGSAFYSRIVAGRQFRPETLSAIILRKLKLDAEQKIGPISKAVITVPAFFDDSRRKATEDAGRIAGLEVLDIINEPTAAALAYAVKSHKEEGASGRLLDLPSGKMTVLVYDLGGGTFDVSIVRLSSNRFETLATDGEVWLGGKDWDDRIIEYLAQEYREEFGVDPVLNEHRRHSLAAVAEKGKILLSALKSAPVEFTHAGRTLTRSLSRLQFEEMTSDLLQRTRLATEHVMQSGAGLTWNDVDRVLLVGGSTRMPMVSRMLQDTTGKKPDGSLDADQIVAQGAALHAGIVAARTEEGELEIDEELREQFRDIVELNVNAHSLGVQVVDKNEERVNEILVKKNTQLPVAASKVFRTRHTGSRSIPVKILEGEAREAANNIQIGTCRINDLPPGLPKRSPVQVRLAYDASGRISVTVLDMTYGGFAQITIKRQNRLTEAEIQREEEFVKNLEFL